MCCPLPCRNNASCGFNRCAPSRCCTAYLTALCPAAVYFPIYETTHKEWFLNNCVVHSEGQMLLPALGIMESCTERVDLHIFSLLNPCNLP